jgi:hypothetical protein
MMKEQTTANDLFRDRSPTVVALDNLIRRKLRVSDPNDPQEIAGALRKLYKAEKEAMDREAGGMPFLLTSLPAAPPASATSSQAEVDQAVSDVERDLKALTTNSLLKDIEPELKGWGSAIRAAMADGINAARMALDPRQRDLAFAMRRLLGDYARVSRYVGALTPNLNIYYRRLAQSLDEVAGVLLVLMGEALANVGFSGGRFLLQAPVSELQERRDAAVAALRNLIGSVQEAYGSNQWPRGLVAYRQFLNRLDTSGQSDLKAMFQENTLARMMDDLIDRAAGSTADGLRALGATAQLGLEAFRRLITFGQHLVDPESPPLTAFLSALQLFMDAFTNAASGYRLLFSSRPPILFYGLYGMGGIDTASRRLLNLIILRGQLADMLDCHMGCGCETDAVRCQIYLDKFLYDMDRAIDLYARGTDPDGTDEPEYRAAATGYIAEEILDPLNCAPAEEVNTVDLRSNIRRVLELAQTELWGGWTFEVENPFSITVVADGIPVSITDIEGFDGIKSMETVWDAFRNTLRSMYDKINSGNLEGITEITGKPQDLMLLESMYRYILQELCIQKKTEEQWKTLLQTMAPSCMRYAGVLDDISRLINGAILSVAGEIAACPEFDPSIPPTLETSLAGHTYGRWSEG